MDSAGARGRPRGVVPWWWLELEGASWVGLSQWLRACVATVMARCFALSHQHHRVFSIPFSREKKMCIIVRIEINIT